MSRIVKDDDYLTFKLRSFGPFPVKEPSFIHVIDVTEPDINKQNRIGRALVRLAEASVKRRKGAARYWRRRWQRAFDAFNRRRR